MSEKTFIIFAVVIGLIFTGVLFGLKTIQIDTTQPSGATENQTEGTQEVVINVRGGYQPSKVTAKANVATTLKMVTNNTVDCSSSLTIPKLNVNQQLPPTGETVINITPGQAVGTVTGMCSMGMYNFEIKFQ